MIQREDATFPESIRYVAGSHTVLVGFTHQVGNTVFVDNQTRV